MSAVRGAVLCLALAAPVAHAEPEPAPDPAFSAVSRFEAFVFKSGAWVSFEIPGQRGPATVSFLRDAPGWDAVVRTCPLDDASAWLALTSALGAVGQGEGLPPATALLGPSGKLACTVSFAFGTTDETRNVLTLTVDPVHAAVFQTTISRREAEALTARLATLVQEISNLPEPVSAAPATPEVPKDVAVASARTLYALKGWRRAGDPGWEADIEAVRRAVEVGWLPSDVVVRGMEDRRMRPGALADVLGL